VDAPAARDLSTVDHEADRDDHVLTAWEGRRQPGSAARARHPRPASGPTPGARPGGCTRPAPQVPRWRAD